MVTNIDHLNLSVESFENTALWYQRVFGFEVVERGFIEGRPWGVLKAGDAMLCVYQHSERKFVDGDGLAENNLHGFNHFALKITDRQAWESTIAKEKIAINYGGPITWPHSTSWYVNDPTGYEIEVALWQSGRPAFSRV